MICPVCGKECTCCTRTCDWCGRTFTPNTANQRFCSPNCRWNNTNAIRYNGPYTIYTSSAFIECVRDLIENRQGSMLGVKRTTKTALIKIGKMKSRRSRTNDDKFVPKQGEIIKCYQVVERMMEEAGGVYFSNNGATGKKYKFPLKEREK